MSDYRALIESLDDADVRYVVIGGVALRRFGMRGLKGGCSCPVATLFGLASFSLA